ncbi:MAG: hypothetical protein RSE93_06395 [Oscillospiraceae bacterium]
MKLKKFAVAPSFLVAIIAIIIKTIDILLYYNETSGIIQGNFINTTLNIIFYACIVLIIILGVSSTKSTAKYSKKILFNETIIMGYILFFCAVMFIIQGLLGFYHNLDQHFSSNVLSQYNLVRRITPFLCDIFACLSAFSFYKMAMQCFRDEGEPRKKLFSAIFPSIWGVLMVIYSLFITYESVIIQSYAEQISFYCFMLLFLYYTTVHFYECENGKKTLVTEFVRINFGIIASVVFLPYVFAGFLGIKDTLHSLPNFAVTGLCIYSIALFLQYNFYAAENEK